MKILVRNSYDKEFPSYYIEDEAELANIPENAPSGTIIECNATSGFKVFMKHSSGVFNEL